MEVYHLTTAKLHCIGIFFPFVPKKNLFNDLPSSLTKVNLLGSTVAVTPRCLPCRFLMEVKQLKIATPRKINK